MKAYVKICGLRSDADLQAVADAGASYGGFVFFDKSPRAITPEAAGALHVPAGLRMVALVVDADDALLDKITQHVALHMIQLHGHETPARVAELRARYGLPVMKVLSIAGAEDLAAIADYEDVADQIMLDAKAPKGATRPGGNGNTFDWTLLQGRQWRKPWMLAGGLTPDNVAQARDLTGAVQLDASSSLESSPGVKDPVRIRAFVAAALR